MKALISSVIIASLAVNGAMAQASKSTKHHSTVKAETKTQETIIIKKENDGKETVIELKDGDLYVNDEKVTTLDATDKNSNKKIILQHGGGHSYSYTPDEPSNIAPQAVLGVMTAPAEEGSSGAYVKEVMPNSAAEAAGLKAGDIIHSLDGAAIKTPADLVSAVKKHKAGDEVTVGYERSDKQREVTATLKKGSAQNNMQWNMSPFEPGEMQEHFPLDLYGDLAPARPKLGIAAEDMGGKEGVRVAEVRPFTPAAKAGLRKNDIITKLNDKAVTSVDQLQDLLQDAQNEDNVLLTYTRAGELRTTEVALTHNRYRKNL